ncbi:MAG: DNA-binding transcriptional ArsR family regulator [Polaribacter sp.]
MNLTNAHTAILVKIHDAENERISKSQFADIKLDHPNLEQLLKDLEELELVEFEIKENAYYLTYEAYELVERLKNPPKVMVLARKSNAEEYEEVVNFFGGEKNFLRSVTIGFFLVTALVATLIYLTQDRTIAKTGNTNIELSDESKKEIESHLIEVIDSIEAVRGGESE